MALRIEPLEGLPEVTPDHELGTSITRAIDGALEPDEVIVVAQKIVSKAEGQFIALSDVEPGTLARRYAPECGKDPRLVQVILDQSQRIIKMEPEAIIAETPHGFVCANAGVDGSNVDRDGVVLTLPKNPDQSAKRIRDGIDEVLGVRPPVIITDTWGRPWREGQVNFAIGVSGLAPLRDYRGSEDTTGKELEETLIADADELAGAAELVMGKTKQVPAVRVQGYERVGRNGNGQSLVRPREHDFFR